MRRIGAYALLILITIRAVTAEESLPRELPIFESNFWPISVEQRDSATGVLQKRDLAGPLIAKDFEKTPKVTALRPFWVNFRSGVNGEIETAHFLYPLFNYQSEENSIRWDIFRRIRFQRHQYKDGGFERRTTLFPFYFSGHNSDFPEKSYRGLFPIIGSVPGSLGYDRISWILFPFYSRWERGEEVTWAAPWPFLKVRRGGGSRGFHMWPLYGKMERPGEYRHRFWLWPFIYDQRSQLQEEVPHETFGVLPFYASEDAAGLKSRSWLWPFFGYTDRVQQRYHQSRYLWPLWVVERSERKKLDRWLPFFARTEAPGYRKLWYLWPFLKKERYQQDGRDITKSQVLFFLYWSMQQSHIKTPDSPAAYRKHLWPLFSSWDNGQGRRQFQFLSPFESFFQDDPVIRELYSPLFAFYRSEQKAPDHKRIEIFFKLLTYETHSDRWRFNLGPFVTLEKHRFKILNGLFGVDREQRKFQLMWIQF